MYEHVDRLAGVVGLDRALEHEFEARLTESSTLAFRVAYSVLRHREDAEDVAQEAFAKAYRNFRQLRDRDRFRAWLVRMTWRLALDRQRADRRRLLRDGVHANESASSLTQENEVSRDLVARLWNAIDALPPKLRLVIVLSSIEGHNISEVAALLGLSAGTVKSRLFRARQQLKELLHG